MIGNEGGRRASLRDFSTRVAGLNLLTAPVQTALAGHIQHTEEVQQIIHIPSTRVPQILEGAWTRFNHLRPAGRSPETVLVSLAERLLIVTLPNRGSPPVVRAIPIADILSVELGSVLLFAWLSIRWAQDGQLACTHIFFNSVGEDIFAEVVERISQTWARQANLPSGKHGRGLDLLEPLPYKFKNIIANRLLLPDESLEQVIFRPAVWRKRLGIFPQLVEPNLALLVTNLHALVMYESKGGGSSRYGVIFRYCPRQALGQARLESGPQAALLDLVLERAGAAETLDFTFPPEETAALQALAYQWPARNPNTG